MKVKALVRVNGRDKERTVYEKGGISYVHVNKTKVQVWLRSDGVNYADYQFAW